MADLNSLIPDYQGNLTLQDNLNVTDTKLQQQRLQRNFQERKLPELMDYYSGRGTFFSGHSNLRAAQAGQDVADQSGDLERMLARQGADLARKRLLATAGVFA